MAHSSDEDDENAISSRPPAYDLPTLNAPYRRKSSNLKRERTNSEENSSNGVVDKATSSSYAARVSKASSSEATGSKAKPIALDSDEEEVSEDHQAVEYSDDDLHVETSSSRNRDRLPLIPTDFYSIEEALQNFVAVFESRYGANHPPFHIGPLQEAISLAFDNPQVLERSPMAVYLHHDDSVASNIFVTQILCNSNVSQLLKRQFVNWAWDMTQEENRSKLIDWLAMLNMGDLADMLRQNATDRYPILVVLTRDRGTITPIVVCRGQDSPTTVIENLMHALDEYQRIKNRDNSDERERIERERVMQEQHDEYQRSLEADRAKDEERKRQQQLAIEEDAKRQREIEENEIRKAQLASSLPDEPPEGGNVITIRLRLPNGEFKIRRFKMEEPIRWLTTYAESIGYSMENYRLWNSAVPKEDVSTFDNSKSFAELNWPRREQIVVEEKL
uniref:UBX domain-containing protein n=1 Tax=Acrobeloides nanus TaxID=290746 RepID=A0A914D585_9BILA